MIVVANIQGLQAEETRADKAHPNIPTFEVRPCAFKQLYSIAENWI